MFAGKIPEKPKGKYSSPKQSQSFLLKGQKLQKNNDTDLAKANSFSFCSCKCKCHQCCGELADSLNSQLQDLQKKYNDIQLLITSEPDEDNDKGASLDGELKYKELDDKVKSQEEILKQHQNCFALLEDLSSQVRELSGTIKGLETDMMEKESNYNEDIERRERQFSTDFQSQKEAADFRFEGLKTQHRQEMDLLVLKHKEDLKVKDAIIAVLKERAAQSFDFNARERKEQIDELVKEVKRVSTEAAVAQASLAELRLQKMDQKEKCNQCDILQKEVDLLYQKIEEKDSMIEDLNAVCNKMRNQLVFQGELNDLLRQSKEWHR